MNRRIKIRILPPHSVSIFTSLNKLLVFLLIISSFAMGVAYYYTKLCPLITNVAAKMCSQNITRMVNDVIHNEVEQHAFTYEDFATIQRNESGKISAMFMNTKQINSVKSSLAVKLQDTIASADKMQIKIPLGAILEGYILSDFGPTVDVSLNPIGYALIDFESSFSEAGINQTKHQIDIIISADFGVVMGSGSESISIKTTVPVAQTIIVGDVPDYVF